MKELLILKGNTIGFHPQTQSCIIQVLIQFHMKVLLKKPFILMVTTWNFADRLNSGKTSRHNMVYECIYFDYFGPDATLDFHVEDQPY